MNKPYFVWDEQAQAGYLYLRSTTQNVERTVDIKDDEFNTIMLVDYTEDGEEFGLELLRDITVGELLARAAERGVTEIQLKTP